MVREEEGEKGRGRGGRGRRRGRGEEKGGERGDSPGIERGGSGGGGSIGASCIHCGQMGVLVAGTWPSDSPMHVVFSGRGCKQGGMRGVLKASKGAWRW